MDPQLLETVAGVVHGCRWAALATVGRGVPLATQVAWVADADFCGGLLLLSRLENPNAGAGEDHDWAL